MPTRRRYALTVTDALIVTDWPDGPREENISRLYGNVPPAPAWGRTAATLSVSDGLAPALDTNGIGGICVGQACTELLAYFMTDLALHPSFPRAF
jgi:hypothetical protein